MLGDLTVRLSAITSDFVVPVRQAHAGIVGVSDMATTAEFNIGAMSRSLLSVASASRSLGFVSEQIARIGHFSGLAATGLGTLSGAVSFVGGAAFRVASGMSMLLVPLEGLMILTRAIIAPFRLLISLMVSFTKAVWMAAQPLLKLAMFVFQVKVALTSLGIQFQLIRRFLGMLSPQMRILVVGLTALGLSGRAGAAAMGIFARAVKIGTVAVLALTNPLAALRVVILSTAMSFAKLTFAVIAATRALSRMAVASTVAGVKSLGQAVMSVASTIATNLVGALAMAAPLLAAIGIGAAGWGVKLAADAEQAEVAFTTMLKNGRAARKVLGDLEQFAASTPFQLADLQDGAKQLLNAQVPTSQLTDKLRMLGDIAAGTGKPILDFARIYSKVKATGKVSLDSLNQLAERGVPIYSALATQLGVSRQEMLEMISKGKVGFSDLDAAITSTATGTGVFAGGMAAQSQAMAGLFSTMKDNISFAMRELGQQISDAFNFKGAMNTGITFFQNLKAGIASMKPVFQATAIAIHAGFSAIWEVASVVWNSIMGLTGLAGGDIMATMMEVLAIITWVFQSWPDIVQLAFEKMTLYSFQAFEEIKHFFVGVIPAMLSWFARNWQDVFITGANFVVTVMKNLGKNMMSIWSGILSFITGNGFKVDFTPLTEGFKNTISEMPNIPERAMGQIEENMLRSVVALEKKVAGDLQAELEKNMNLLDAHRKSKPEDLTGADATGNADPLAEEGMGTAQKQKQEAGIMERGSSEALKAIFGGQNKGQIAEQKKSNGLLKQIASNTKSQGTPGPQLKVQGAV